MNLKADYSPQTALGCLGPSPMQGQAPSTLVTPQEAACACQTQNCVVWASSHAHEITLERWLVITWAAARSAYVLKTRNEMTPKCLLRPEVSTWLDHWNPLYKHNTSTFLNYFFLCFFWVYFILKYPLPLFFLEKRSVWFLVVECFSVISLNMGNYMLLLETFQGPGASFLGFINRLSHLIFF